MLLDAASDDVVDPDQTRRLLKEMREVRSAKIRSGVDALDLAAGPGGGIALTGIGAMEIGEGRGFIGGVVDGLRYALLLHLPAFIYANISNVCSDGLVLQKNKLVGSRWQKLPRMVVMTPRRTMTMIWSSRMT